MRGLTRSCIAEMVDRKITKVKKLRTKLPVIEYLNKQKRYQHLVASDLSQETLQAIQDQADQNIAKYGLMA